MLFNHRFKGEKIIFIRFTKYPKPYKIIKIFLFFFFKVAFYGVSHTKDKRTDEKIVENYLLRGYNGKKNPMKI